MAVASLQTMAGLKALRWAPARRWPAGRWWSAAGSGDDRGAVAGRQGIGVDLVEREGELGGQWRSLRYQADGSDPQAALAGLIAQVRADENIAVHLSSELKALEGSAGSYRSVIASGEQEQVVEHGVLVVATGGRPAPTSEYLYGSTRR